MTAPYYAISTFDELPTPFRAVSVDLLSATQVVLDRGSLASAMRATMSLPLIFPPVEMDGKVLVDGGAMNNVPADVARSMGADVVIAINVGDLTDPKEVNQTMFGLAGGTLGAMMRASTKQGLAAADVVLNVPLVEKGYGSLDWRKSKELIEEGYKAAEAIKEQLLKYAVSEAEYQKWAERRNAARRVNIPPPAFVEFEGVVKSDEQRMVSTLAMHVGRPLDIPQLELDLAELAGLDRYETVGWRLVSNQAGEVGLLVRARQKPNAPPFMMLGVSLENTTSDSFGVSLSARYLTFDVPLAGSELRVDGTVGSNPVLGMEWYQPLGKSPLFFAPYAGVTKEQYNIVQDDAVVARYDELIMKGGINLGVNLGAFSDIRLGAYIGRLDAHRRSRRSRASRRHGKGDGGGPDLASQHAGQPGHSVARPGHLGAHAVHLRRSRHRPAAAIRPIQRESGPVQYDRIDLPHGRLRQPFLHRLGVRNLLRQQPARAAAVPLGPAVPPRRI